MDRLVDQHPAAFGSPFSPPAALRVIGSAPVPRHNPLHADEPAQHAGIDGLFNPDGSVIIAVLKDHAKLPLAGCSRFLQPPGGGHIQGHRLLR
ncbi:hypothetical protein D3C75_939430 [compost metagenome]